MWAGQVRFRLSQLKPHNGIIYLCLWQAGRRTGKEWASLQSAGPVEVTVTLRYITLRCVALSYVPCPFATCMLTRRLSDMMKIMEQKMSLGMAKTCVPMCVCVIYIWADSLTTVSQATPTLVHGLRPMSSCCRPKMIY